MTGPHPQPAPVQGAWEPPAPGTPALATGAEAAVTRGLWMGRDAVWKVRLRKGYRHHRLDAPLRARRTRDEASILAAARRAGVRVPVVLDVDRQGATLVLEHVEGTSLKAALASDDAAAAAQRLQALGRATAKLHQAGITHGDLTTSNVLVPRGASPGELVLIDFGLAQHSTEAEERGVDLHLVEEALEATHADGGTLFRAFLQGYGSWPGRDAAVERLEDIRQRGRYR